MKPFGITGRRLRGIRLVIPLDGIGKWRLNDNLSQKTNRTGPDNRSPKRRLMSRAPSSGITSIWKRNNCVLRIRSMQTQTNSPGDRYLATDAHGCTRILKNIIRVHLCNPWRISGLLCGLLVVAATTAVAQEPRLTLSLEKQTLQWQDDVV